MAAFFWIHGGANNNWATNGNWSATSGGGSNAAQPSVTSDVTFDGVGANGNDASTIAAIQSVLSLTFAAGYTNTVTVSAALTIAGNFTDRTNHTWAGSSGMTISAASTITSNGKTWPNAVTFTGANTKTLSGDWTVTGLLTISAATTFNTATINVAGGFNHGTAAIIGTTTINLTGGTWTGASGSSTVSNPITIAGNVTLSANVGLGSGATVTYTSGTVTTTSSTLLINASCTLNTAGISWNNISIVSTSTVTNNSLLTATGTFQVNSGAALTMAGTTGWTVATFSELNVSSRTHTFANTLTYTFTTSFSSFKGGQGVVIFTSDHASNLVKFIMPWDCVCNTNASFTRVDATGGRPFVVFNPTLTTCTNFVSQTNVLTPSPNFNRRFGRGYIEYNRAKTVVYQTPKS